MSQAYSLPRNIELQIRQLLTEENNDRCSEEMTVISCLWLQAIASKDMEWIVAANTYAVLGFDGTIKKCSEEVDRLWMNGRIQRAHAMNALKPLSRFVCSFPTKEEVNGLIGSVSFAPHPEQENVCGILPAGMDIIRDLIRCLWLRRMQLTKMQVSTSLFLEPANEATVTRAIEVSFYLGIIVMLCTTKMIIFVTCFMNRFLCLNWIQLLTTQWQLLPRIWF